MGFFFSNTKTKIKDTKLKIAEEYGCYVCPRNNLKINSPKMLPTGTNTPLFYFLGESPGSDEDDEGEQFVGSSGRVLRESLYKYINKKDVDNYIRWNNVVRCFNDNITPNPIEISCCRASLLQDIEDTQPIVVVGFGGIPLKTFVDGNKITLWRGRLIPIKVGNHVCWFYSMFHPSFILRNRRNDYVNELDKCFDLDMKFIVDFVLNNYEKPEYVENNHTDNIIIVMGNSQNDIKFIEAELERMLDEEYVAIDIETTTLKPYNKNSKIVSCAIGTYSHTIAFPLDHISAWNFGNRNVNLTKCKNILYDFLLKKSGKIAHNLKFEAEWLYSLYNDKRVLYENTWEDSMAQAVLLDERTAKKEGMLKLDRLTLINFGFNLKPISDIDFKNIEKNPLDKLLLYNGLDSKYEHKLFMKQKPKVDRFFKSNYRNLVDTALSLAITQNLGLPTDDYWVNKLDIDYSSKLEDLDVSIGKLKEVKEFTKTKGKFNIMSPDHLTIIFRDMLKLPQIKITEKGKFSVDNEVMASYKNKGIVLAQYVTDYRAYTKLKSTYVDKVKSLTINGLVHPNYNHLFTSTGRLSSGKEDEENDSDINFQNFNKHANREIRNMIKAPDGYIFVAIDYGQLEARCLAMASNDLEFSGAIWSGEDTHMRWTDRMIELYPQVLDYVKTKKDLRNDNKSNLTFAIFYGASKYSVIDYYARTYKIPERIMEQTFDEFWSVYTGVKKWQDDTLKFYDKYGYVQSLTGRRRRMPMKKNEIINLPIQNTASFDICVCAGNRLSKLAHELDKPQYQYRLNIHDDLSFFIPEETFEDDVLFIAKEMVRPAYDFITVPLEVEISTGTNWGELKDLCKFTTLDFWEYKNNRWVNII